MQPRKSQLRRGKCLASAYFSSRLPTRQSESLKQLTRVASTLGLVAFYKKKSSVYLNSMPTLNLGDWRLTTT